MPFQGSLNTSALHSAFDQLVGQGKWIPYRSVGTFPVRFPTEKQPNDVRKHVDASFAGEARLLSKEGDQCLSFMELAGRLYDLPQRKAVHATGFVAP